ncbi:ABC transporter ATP-binding protein [Candidatus Avoscillospira sp. LCP25S3_F1]|uniref:ABC transporter ATP-binding protein n=1 Tax=Candidatus Avoscillospira sp. LCP25S3_F1 TaxID=3438825 RepID=UPI003F8F525B
MKDLRRLAHYFRPQRRYLILAALLVLVETAFELFIPVLMATLIDEGVANEDIPLMLHQGVLMGLFALISLVTGFLQARYAARASYGFGADLRRAQYEAVQKLAFSNLDHFETSSLVTRMTTDVTVLQNAFNTGFRAVFRSPVMLLMGLALSFYMSPPLAVIFFLCVPVLAVILWAIVRKVAPSYRVLQKAVDRMNNVVQEHLTAMRAIKAFVREDYAKDRFETVNSGLMEASRYTFKTAVLNTPAFQLTMYGATVLLLWFGGRMILAGTLEVGQLTGFLSYVMQVMNSLMLVSNVFLLLTRSLASCHRILEVLDEVPAIDNPANAVTEVADGSIDFDDVSFRYSADAKTDALSHVDLHIRSGQTVGILGGTGSAKTTLVQLIPRLYDVTGGTLRVGGRDVRDYDLHALREAVGIVLQKNVLFSGTVRENLQWGNADATDEELWDACRTACADEFLKRMPKGLDSDLGQGGVNVSGGQKQRLCIARALLKSPKILIFDDSTSAVDMATEAKIRTALAQRRDVTKLIIAQRITSVQNADVIVILDDGKVHAVGNHDTLLATDPIYQEIYHSQVKGGDGHGQTHQ